MIHKTQAEVEADMRKDPAWSGYFKSLDTLLAQKYEIKRKQDALLKELGVKITFDDVMSLLKDEKRLKEVVSKLKLKAFW